MPIPDGREWQELPLGSGRVLFSALPIELSDKLEGVGHVYGYAMKKGGINPQVVLGKNDPGILVCPTEYENDTLYVLTSETERRVVGDFHSQPLPRLYAPTANRGSF